MKPSFFTKTIIAVVSALAIFSIPTVLAAPTANAQPNDNSTSYEKRQGTFTSAAVGFLAPLIQNAIWGAPAQCCDDIIDTNCWAAKGEREDGLENWDLCYTPGTQIWTERDAEVAKCLTNLHYVQDDICISVAGSMCDNGYIAAGGRIQNAQMSGFYARKLTGAESGGIQVAIAHLVGQGIETDQDESGIAHWPVFGAIDPSNGFETAALFFRYIGEDAC